MRTSVIIPCRNAERTVADAVASALAQSEPPFEVVVVDDASTDASADVARRAGARVLVNATRRNAGGARNAGIEATSGELLAFLDADAIAAPDWIARARARLEADPRVAGVGGRIVNGRPGRYGELDYFLNHSEWIGRPKSKASAGPKANIPTMAIVYRRDAVGRCGSPRSNSGEDTVFALAVAAGGRRTLWYDPEIRVTHRHERLDRRAFWEKQVACGRTIYQTRSRLDRPGRILVRAPVLLLLFPHLWIERLVELGERLGPRELALFDLVQGLLHPRGIGGLEEVVEVRDQHLDDRPAERRRNEAPVLLVHVPALLELAQDLGVGGRAADAVLLEELDERGLVEPRRRLRRLLLGREREELQGLALLERRQLRRVLVGLLFLIRRDPVGREVARKPERRAGGAVDGLARRDLGRGRVVDRGRHLRGDEALPDQPVEARLLGRDVLGDLVGRQVEVGRADRLVRVLGVPAALEVTRGLGLGRRPVLSLDQLAHRVSAS